jgi:hypothetical protein
MRIALSSSAQQPRGFRELICHPERGIARVSRMFRHPERSEAKPNAVEGPLYPPAKFTHHPRSVATYF